MKPACSQAPTPPPHYALHCLKPASPRPLAWALLNTGHYISPALSVGIIISASLTDTTRSEI